MESNGTHNNYPVFAGIAAYDCAGLLGNVLTIIVVNWTPSLKGLTGRLIVHEQTACSLVQFFSMFTYLSANKVSALLRLISSTLVTSTRMCSSLFLTLQNVNLYLALCRPMSYRTTVTEQRAKLVIMFTWLATLLLTPITVFSGDHAMEGCITDILMMLCSIQELWIHAVALVCGLLLPLVCNFLCLWRVSVVATKVPPNITLRLAYERNNKLKKVKFIFVSTILNSVFVVPLFVLSNLSHFFSGGSEAWHTVLIVLWSLSKIHQNFRLVVYFCTYKPIRESTTSKLFCFSTVSVAPLQSQVTFIS